MRQYPEFGRSSASIQDALADVVQTEAGRARRTHVKGLFMKFTSTRPPSRTRVAASEFGFSSLIQVSVSGRRRRSSSELQILRSTFL